MKIPNARLFVLLSVFLAGLLILIFFYGEHQQPSSSTGTILFLLAVGLIGAVGVCRRKQDTGSHVQRKAKDIPPKHENVKENGKKLIARGN